MQVGDVTSTSFAFNVTSHDYFDPAGSQITFSTCESSGDVFLQQHGSAPNAGFLSNLIAPTVARGTWDSQAANLRDLLIRLSAPPSGNPWAFGLPGANGQGPTPPAYFPGT